MLMVEWTSDQFSFYNNRIQDLMDDFNATGTMEEQDRALDELVAIIDEFVGIGQEDLAELRVTDPRDRKKLVGRYTRNLATLGQMRTAIVNRDYSDLRQYAGSMRQMAFPPTGPTADAPFKVLMGFLSNMQLVGHKLGVVRGGRRFEDKENECCPVCESELCRCCPDCEQPECKCEEDAADRIKMISDFIPEDL